MKNKKNKLVILFLILILFSGCTKQLTKDNKVVSNPETGQSLTENILCKPSDSKMIKLYEENGVKIESLPNCEKYNLKSGKYEGLWDSIIVKPLAWLILKIGNYVKSYGLSLIIVSLVIRFIAFPVTKKTAMQSELMKNAKPELDKLEKKYKDKNDQESLMKKNQEMMLIYKKYNINPISGCVFALIQLPLFIGFLEAINRVPAIFEEKFLLFQLGTTPKSALFNGNIFYIILIFIVALTTYYSFKFNSASVGDSSQTKSMNRMMVIMITIMSIFMTSALDIYWITTNVFTIIQNMIVKRGVKNEKI